MKVGRKQGERKKKENKKEKYLKECKSKIGFRI